MSTTYQSSVPDPPLHEQQWSEPQSELSESTLRGSPNLPDHPKGATPPHSSHREEVMEPLPPSHQGVDGAVARRPRSTGRHVRVTKDSTNLPAREYDVTMSFHGSRSRGQRVRALYPHSTTLGPSRVHAPSYWLGIGDPIPLPLKHIIR